MLDVGGNFLTVVKTLMVGNGHTHSYGVLSYFPTFVFGFIAGGVQKSNQGKSLALLTFIICSIFMKKWLLFGKERKSKRFWYILVGLTIFLVCSFFVILFLSIKSENPDGFFKDWSCNNFENNKDHLIDWVEPSKKWILIGDEIAEEEKLVILKVKLGSKAKRYFDRPDSIKIFYELVNT